MKSESGGWRAEWIWASQSFGMNEFAYFRKSLMITRPVRRAVLRGTAHNHYRAMVNGERVSGEVVPAPSNPEKGKLYNQYDVTAHIRLGENVLSAAVCYLGGSGQNYVDGVPGLRMQLELTYPDGSAETFGTDCSWKCLSDTPYQNHTEFSHRRRIGPMEVFDARKEPEGWQRPGFSDGDWQDAVPAPEETAAWQLKPQRIPEGIVERLLTPRLCGMAENVRVYDAGKILSGWPVLSLRGAAAGQRFTLRYSEDLDERGRVKHNVCNDLSEFYCDCYIAGGRPQEEWRPDFCYKAFRYCEIESDGPLPEGCALFLAEAHTGIRQTGSFDCGDPMLNALFDACIQTQKNNALGQLVDCPHREQAQYLADADLQAESLLYHFDGAAMVEKVLADFADGQHADGSFPFVYPSNFEHPNFSLKIPEWDLHFILLLWKLFRHTGEEALLERYYLPAERTLRRQLGFVDESGLVRKTEDWHISDWPYPELEQSGSYYTVHNCLVYRCAVLMSRIAQMCGRAQDAEWFSAQVGSLREAILRRFYDPARKAFRDSDGSGQFSQAVSAAAMSCGVVPREEQEAVLARIASAGHHTSTLLSLDLLRLLFENGRGGGSLRAADQNGRPQLGADDPAGVSDHVGGIPQHRVPLSRLERLHRADHDRVSGRHPAACAGISQDRRHAVPCGRPPLCRRVDCGSRRGDLRPLGAGPPRLHPEMLHPGRSLRRGRFPAVWPGCGSHGARPGGRRRRRICRASGGDAGPFHPCG